MMKKVIKLFCTFLCVFGLLACQNQSNNTSKEQVIVVMGTSSEPQSGFDPSLGWGSGEHVHSPLIQSTLTITKEDLSIGFDLAVSMDYDAEKLLWRIDIRDDVYFSNGTKLSAEDVAFTYNLVKKQSLVNDLTMFEKAYAEDENTVYLQMLKPFSPWPYTMAHIGIIPKDFYNEDYGQKPIGSGPYLLAQWNKGQQIILEANPNYYGERAKIPRLIVLFMEEDAAFAAVMAKKVDASYTSPIYSQEQIEGYKLLSVESVDNRGINLPTVPHNNGLGNDFTAELLVRKALNFGIDRQAIIDKVLYGHATIAYTVADKMPWYNTSAEVNYDFAKAVALLEEGGWQLSANGIREKNGIRAELNILYPIGNSLRQSMAAELSNQFIKLGIKSSFEGVDWNTAYARAHSQPLVWGWGTHSPMEMYNIYHTAPNKDFARYSPYASAKVDENMDLALAEDDLASSLFYWKKAQEVINQDLPWLWILNVNHLYWVREELEIPRQKIHPHGHGWAFVDNVVQWTWAK